MEMQTVSKEEIQQFLDILETTPSQTIAKNGSLNWEEERVRFGFAQPLPVKPELPQEPKEPVFPTPPREDDAAYDVQLEWLDKILSSRRIKKQQAALNRFERDRKAWNDDRKHGIALYEMAKKKREEQVEALEADYEEAVSAWKKSFSTFLKDFSTNGA